MGSQRVPGVTLAALLLALSPPVAAQTMQPLPRALVTAAGGYQPGGTDFTDTITIQRYAEAGTIEANHEVGGAPFADGGFLYRFWRGFGAGLSVSASSDTGHAPFRAAVPHPFYFNRPRSVSGEAIGLRRREASLHMRLAYLLPASESLLVVVGGGPTLFKVKQDVIGDISVDESYPYDVATLHSVGLESVSGSRVGFNAGVDLVWRLRHNLGAGMLCRFSRARVDLKPAGGRTIPIDVGGFHAGAGLWLLF